MVIKTLLKDLKKNVPKDIEKITYVNIGTDRAIGDSFAPLFGTLVKQKQGKSMKLDIYGDLHSPIHALNIRSTLEVLRINKREFVIGIDATLIKRLGKRKVGEVFYRNGSLHPGKGVGKELGDFGDCAIVCAVDYVDENNKFSFNNIRLSLIYDMANDLADTIIEFEKYRERRKRRINKFKILPNVNKEE